jgi:dihydrolipoamide dehydrogenase
VVVTSDEALCLGRIPETMVIIGGGVIGVEFAYLFQALGTRVTIIELLPDILPGEDEEIRRAFRRSLSQRAVEIHLEARVDGVWKEGDGARVVFVDRNGRKEERRGDMVLLATGRKPSLQGIDPSRLGLAMNGPYVRVNRKMETNLHGVYAVGDLVGGLMTAHAASAQAEVAVTNMLGGDREFDPHKVPRCVWGFPEAAAVGQTEWEARESGRRVRVGKFPYEFSGKAQAIGEVEGFVKIIGDEDNGEILGVHIFGESATELIGEVLLAVNIEAAVEDLGQVVKPHPTLSECLKEAALAWEGRPLHMIPDGR